MATSFERSIAIRAKTPNHKTEKQFQQYLQSQFSHVSFITSLAIMPFLLFLGGNNISSATITHSPSSDRPVQKLQPVNSYPSNMINTVLATLLGGGGLVALWRVKSETDAKAHEFSIKLLTMQKELLESNRTEVVQYFERRADGITQELQLIRDRLAILEHEVSQLVK